MGETINLGDVSRREILRYMGCRGEVPRQVLELAEKGLAMLGEVLDFRYEVREFPLSLSGERIETECFQTCSRNLAKNLKDCDSLLLFGATLGIRVDQLIRRTSRQDVSLALALQAGAAAVLEECCDQSCTELKKQYIRKGLYLRPRFSPGYGDFPLNCQPAILAGLDAGKRLGIRLTEGCLMLPTKSVTAVMGIGSTPVACMVSGCEACGKKDCPYRRETGHKAAAEESRKKEEEMP